MAMTTDQYYPGIRLRIKIFEISVLSQAKRMHKQHTNGDI